MDTIFFDGWEGLKRILVVGPLAYVGLVLFLRVTGKRALAKLNSFDLVITVALGSSLATTVLSSDTSLAEGALAFAVLLALQYVVTWLSARSDTVEQLVKNEPTLLVHRGRHLYGAMRRERITEDEVMQAMRASSAADDVDVVLETDGTLSVLSGPVDERRVALRNVAGSREAPEPAPAEH